jgi:hypothetical protein
VRVSTINLLTLVGCVALAAAGFVLAPGKPARTAVAPLHPLAAVPAGAAFVVTLDLARLRRHDLGATLAGPGREIPGLGRLEDLCGFDPTSRIRHLALALPHSPQSVASDGGAEFGLAVTGTFEAGRLAECAGAVIARRGGTPVVSRVGTFVSVRDRTGRSKGEIAIREDGLVLLGGGTYLRNMIDAAGGTLPSLRRDERHRALRRGVGADGAVVATWVPPAGWLERWLGTPDSKTTPWAHVRAAALRLDLSSGLGARLMIGCKTPSACQQIAQALDGLRGDVAAPAAGSGPFAAMAKRTRLASTPQEVRVEISLTPDELALLIDAGRAVLGWDRAPAAVTNSSSAPPPDEVLRPPPRAPVPTPPPATAPPKISAASETASAKPRPRPRPAAEGIPAHPPASAASPPAGQAPE